MRWEDKERSRKAEEAMIAMGKHADRMAQASRGGITGFIGNMFKLAFWGIVFMALLAVCRG